MRLERGPLSLGEISSGTLTNRTYWIGQGGESVFVSNAPKAKIESERKVKTRTLLKMLLATLFTVLVICTVTTLVAADGPDAQASLGELTLQISFQEDGSWRANIDLGASEIRPTSEPTTIEWTGLLRLVELTPEFLERTLFTPEVLEAMGIDSLRVPTETVEFWMKKGVQHLAVQKVSLGPHQEINVYANDEILASVKVSDGMIDLALQEAGKEVELDEGMMALLGGILKMGAKAVLRFPVKEGEEVIPLTLEDKVERVTTPPSNVVRLGATVSGTEKETTLVSVAGITLKEVNELLEGVGVEPIDPTVPSTVFADYEIEKMQLVAGRNGVKLTNQAGDGEERSLEVLWDSESRETVYELLPSAGEYLGWQTLEVYTDVVEMIESWVAETEVEVTLFNEEEPQEGLPEVTIDKPLVAEFDDQAHFYLEGIDLGETVLLPEYIAPYLPIAICYEAGEVRTTIQGNELPIVRLGEGAVETVGGVLAGALEEVTPALSEIPWKKGDELLGNITIAGVVLAARGEVPTEEELNLDYEVVEVEPPEREIVIQVDADRSGNLALWGWTVGTMLDNLGLQATENVKAMVDLLPPSLESTEATIDNTGVRASINDETLVTVAWSEEERRNTALYLPIPDDLPLGVDRIFPKWKQALFDILVGGGKIRWGARVEVTEELPSRGLEEWLSRFGLLPKRLGR